MINYNSIDTKYEQDQSKMWMQYPGGRTCLYRFCKKASGFSCGKCQECRNVDI